MVRARGCARVCGCVRVRVCECACGERENPGTKVQEKSSRKNDEILVRFDASAAP